MNENDIQIDIKILEGLADGKGFVQIGAKLNLPETAVSARARRLYERINVHNAAHAVAWGFRNGYLKISPEPSLEERYKKAMHDLTGHDVCE